MTPVVVVVNDDPTQLTVICGLLRKADLEPRGFANAEDALADMSAGARLADGAPGVVPALVVTDLYMPGIDGFRFCRLLRSPEYAAFNQIPILVVSATFAGEETNRIAAELGAETFLPSPVNGARFIEQVRGILSGQRLRVQPRVLIVDDSRTLVRILKQAFAAHGYQAETALTAQAAADAFAHAAYDVAVLDYHLPDGTGDSLLDAFRASRPDCVCVMITIDPGPKLALDWMKRGAAAYLRKPFQPDYLIELCAKARRERALLRIEDLLEARTRELRESADRFRHAMDATHDGLWDWDVTSACVYYSPAYLGMLGYRADELPCTLQTWLDLVHPDDREHALAANQACVRNETTAVDVEFRMRVKDGSWRWIRSRGHAVRRDAEGHALQMIGTHVDITERRQAEDALRASEERFAKAFYSSPQSLAFTGLEDGRLFEVNESFTSTLGYSREEAIGHTTLELGMWIHQDERTRFVSTLKEHGSVRNAELDLRTKAGDTMTMLVSADLVDVAGKACMLSTFYNISERRRAEEEKARLEAQLQQAQKMEFVGRLAGGVAHDFNNMLLAILGYAELALEQVDPALPLHADLEEIHKAATRSADLTRQLLAFARKQTIAPKVLDLNETIAGMLKMLERLIGEHIHLAWQPGAGLWTVRVDPSQIDQILANLCVNARDAIADVGTITIETENRIVDEDYCADHAGFVPGEYVKLSVSDDGCGMDRETLSRIFEPFFTTKEMGKGTGLGLATVYGTVKQNGGFINAYSEPGQGTTFTAYLPRHVGKAGHVRTDDAAVLAMRGHETILLVEDEPSILKLTAVMLERQGYTVLAARTPGEAIRLARGYPGEIHLLMTDVVMPEMNGRDLARNLLSIYPRIERLFMSGYTADVIAHHGVLEDGVFFIQKPFSIKDLAAKVREAMGGKNRL